MYGWTNSYIKAYQGSKKKIRKKSFEARQTKKGVKKAIQEKYAQIMNTGTTEEKAAVMGINLK